MIQIQRRGLEKKEDSVLGKKGVECGTSNLLVGRRNRSSFNSVAEGSFSTGWGKSDVVDSRDFDIVGSGSLIC